MSQDIKDVMNIRDVKITDLSANPAPLGLMGFGMTTVLLNVHNAGFYPINAMILSMGFFYAFTSYGLFWLTLVGIIMIPKTEEYAVFLTESLPFAIYLFMWGLFTLVMFIGTLKGSKALSVVFLALAILFFLLAAGNYLGAEGAGAGILRIAGYVISWLFALYCYFLVVACWDFS